METQLIVQVARLYYEHNLTQQEIADRLNMSRQKVSRLIIRGREEGIVTISINDPSPSKPDLEKGFMETFNLNDLILTGNNGLDQEGLRQGLGLSASDYLYKTIEDGEYIGIGWGRTLYEVVRTLRKDRQVQVNVIPLLGGTGNMIPSFQVNTLARMFSEAFGGTYRPIYAPVFTKDSREWKTIMGTEEVKKILELFPRLDKAIVGIGHVEFQKKTSMFFKEYISSDALSKLEGKGSVGDICGQFFDIHGRAIADAGNIVGIELGQLRNIPEVIAVAGGEEKVDSILGALNGGFVSTLITDVITARAVLDSYHTKEVHM